MSDNVNSERGEFSLVLDSERFGLRPTFETLSEIEAETGRGLIELAQAALAGKLITSELGLIACAFIRAWGKAHNNTSAAHANPSKITRMIMASDGGVAGAMANVGALLSLAVTGGITAEGEVKAAPSQTAA